MLRQHWVVRDDSIACFLQARWKTAADSAPQDRDSYVMEMKAFCRPNHLPGWLSASHAIEMSGFGKLAPRSFLAAWAPWSSRPSSAGFVLENVLRVGSRPAVFHAGMAWGRAGQAGGRTPKAQSPVILVDAGLCGA